MTDPDFQATEIKRIADMYDVLKTLPGGCIATLELKDIAPFADYVTKNMIASQGEERKAFLDEAIAGMTMATENSPAPTGTSIANMAVICLAWDDPAQGQKYWEELSE